MSIQIILTEKEILETPNNMELGKMVRDRYLDIKKNEIQFKYVNYNNPTIEHEDSPILSKNDKWICSYCGKDTSGVEFDYIVGYDHITCILKNNLAGNK